MKIESAVLILCYKVICPYLNCYNKANSKQAIHTKISGIGNLTFDLFEIENITFKTKIYR